MPLRPLAPARTSSTFIIIWGRFRQHDRSILILVPLKMKHKKIIFNLLKLYALLNQTEIHLLFLTWGTYALNACSWIVLCKRTQSRHLVPLSGSCGCSQLSRLSLNQVIGLEFCQAQQTVFDMFRISVCCWPDILWNGFRSALCYPDFSIQFHLYLWEKKEGEGERIVSSLLGTKKRWSL